MVAKSIQIQVKLFAIYQEVIGRSCLDWQTTAGNSAGQVLGEIIAQHPQLAAWQKVTRLGVNLQFVSADTVLADGDELVLIPPVSGG